MRFASERKRKQAVVKECVTSKIVNRQIAILGGVCKRKLSELVYKTKYIGERTDSTRKKKVFTRNFLDRNVDVYRNVKKKILNSMIS